MRRAHEGARGLGGGVGTSGEQSVLRVVGHYGQSHGRRGH